MFKLHMLQNFKCLFIQKSFITTLDVTAIPKVANTKLELYQSLMMLKPNSPPNSMMLKISVLGCPNSGKSTLVNMLTKWKVCAVSGKINTTRSKQTVVLTQDNVQLCFIDMPGVIGRRKGFGFKLEKSLIRDPHVGIFESDLIICVIDVTHKGSRDELHVELLKSLHFFQDKPAILVLNKIDRVSKRIKLLDITKTLTDGVVGGKVSHRDRYANRFTRKVPQLTELIEDNRMLKLLDKHRPQALLESSNAVENEVDKIAFEKFEESIVEENIALRYEHIGSSENRGQGVVRNEQIDSSEDCGPMVVRNEQIDINKTVENYEENCPSENNEHEEYVRLNEMIEQNVLNNELIESNDYDNFEENDRESRRLEVQSELREVMKILYPSYNESLVDKNDLEADDQILDVLKAQLMLKSATKEEVVARRQKWRKISNTLNKTREICWKHFDDVFAVSSATGEGIDRLRDYLIKRSKPGLWSFHSSLITDQEPETLVQMSVWASCLNKLEKEIPYRLKIKVTNYEKSDDGSLHIFVTINCKTSRELMAVIGKRGSNIATIADESREILENCFQTHVYLKVVAHRQGIASEHLKRMRSAKDFKDLYPKLNND